MTDPPGLQPGFEPPESGAGAPAERSADAATGADARTGVDVDRLLVAQHAEAMRAIGALETRVRALEERMDAAGQSRAPGDDGEGVGSGDRSPPGPRPARRRPFPFARKPGEASARSGVDPNQPGDGSSRALHGGAGPPDEIATLQTEVREIRGELERRRERRRSADSRRGRRRHHWWKFW